jgi:inorganic pyrophosphatase
MAVLDAQLAKHRVSGVGVNHCEVLAMSDVIPFARWRPHPWHGLSAGHDPPRCVQAYIEITPFDAVKYEIDKATGYLRVDRPQQTSALPPALYGFIPRTLCGPKVAALSSGATQGDGDPLDICVFSERPITRAEVLLNTRVVGGLRLIDNGAADDKIIAVLERDPIWGESTDLTALPARLIERLRHYFATYKLVPGSEAQVEVEAVYQVAEAERVVLAALADYADVYGEAAERSRASTAGEP